MMMSVMMAESCFDPMAAARLYVYFFKNRWMFLTEQVGTYGGGRESCYSAIYIYPPVGKSSSTAR